MKRIGILFLGLILSSQLFAQNASDIFTSTCAACHTIGKGLLVGPDLKGSHKKYPEKWLIKWIKSSQSMINAGDKKAVELFTKFNQIPMPDNTHLSDADIKGLIEYIKVQSGDVDAPVSADKAAAPSESTPSESAIPAVTPVSSSPSPSNVNSQALESTPVVAEASLSSGNTVIYWLLGCVILFLTVLLLILTRTLYALLDEIKSIYSEKNKN